MSLQQQKKKKRNYVEKCKLYLTPSMVSVTCGKLKGVWFRSDKMKNPAHNSIPFLFVEEGTGRNGPFPYKQRAEFEVEGLPGIPFKKAMRLWSLPTKCNFAKQRTDQNTDH